MVETARRYGRVFSGGSQRVWEDYNWYHRMMWSGTVGELQEIWVDIGGPSGEMLKPGGARARGHGLGDVARPGPLAAVQQGLSPVQLARLPRLLRRRHDRLGRPSHRRRPVRQPVVQPKPAGGGHPAGRQRGQATDLQVCQRRPDAPGRRLVGSPLAFKGTDGRSSRTAADPGWLRRRSTFPITRATAASSATSFTASKPANGPSATSRSPIALSRPVTSPTSLLDRPGLPVRPGKGSDRRRRGSQSLDQSAEAGAVDLVTNQKRSGVLWRRTSRSAGSTTRQTWRSAATRTPDLRSLNPSLCFFKDTYI